MSLHWCLDEETVLVAAVVVIVNVSFNRRNEGFPVCKCVPVVTFSFEDAPEAFHRAVVNAVSHTRHTLRHTSIIYTPTRNRKYCNFQTCGHRMLNLRKSIRKRIERGTYTCSCCGEQFLPIRADARYCSNACRQKDYRKRKANAV